jgi:hypothetical protein
MQGVCADFFGSSRLPPPESAIGIPVSNLRFTQVERAAISGRTAAGEEFDKGYNHDDTLVCNHRGIGRDDGRPSVRSTG